MKDTYQVENKKSVVDKANASFWSAKNIAVLITCFVIILGVGIVTAAQISIDQTTGVMPGVTVNGYPIEGNNYNEVQSRMNVIASHMEAQLFIFSDPDGETYSYIARNLGAMVDRQEMAEEAFSVCRGPNILVNAFTYWKLKFAPQDISAVVSIDEEKMDAVLEEVAAQVTTKNIEQEMNAAAQVVVVNAGRDQLVTDAKKLREETLAALVFLKYTQSDVNEVTLPVPVSVTPGTQIDLEQLAASIYQEPKDAVWSKDATGQIVLEPSQNGIMLDMEAAKDLIAKATEDSVSLPLIVIKPEKMAEDIAQDLFADELVSYRTNLEVNPPRTHNVRQAASKINGYIVMPGDVFSFNQVVGPRTYETGFKDAKIFVKDEVVDGVGGGICQVTSTLYACTMLADLETVQRRNHRFAVGYITLGYDATVAYGTIDFQFRNNQTYPIKLTAYVEGQRLYVSILGTNTQPEKTVELSTSAYNRKGFEEIERLDQSLAPGTSRVEQKGSSGVSVDTYKTVKINGEVVSKEMIHTSVYTPCNKITLMGPPVEEAPIVPVDPQMPPTDPIDPPGPLGPVEEPPTVPADPAEPADPVEPATPVDGEASQEPVTP